MDRNVSLDILRIFSCLAVIMIHTAGSPICHNMVVKGSVWYDECLLMDSLCRWSVPVFAMLTGFFMLNPSKEVSLKSLFCKYIFRLFTSLLFWSVFYAFTLHKPFYPLGSQEGHFWYVGMCIGLYLALPIMRVVAINHKLLPYFCWMWLMFKVYSFVGAFIKLPIDFGDVIFVDYVGYCLFAYYLKTLSQYKTIRHVVYFLGAMGLAATVAAGLMTQDGDNVFYNYTSPNVIMTAISFFLFAIYHPINVSNRVTYIISSISQCTFGIYLVHLWVLIQLFFRLHRYIPSPIPLCLICVIVTFIWGG